MRGSLPPWGAAGERSEFNIKPPLGAPIQIFPRGYLLKSFPQVDTSARQRGFEIRVFPLLVELPKAIEPHLPVIPLATRSHHVIFAYDQVVRLHRSYAIRVDFPWESHGPATCGFARNCPEPEAWTTGVSGLPICRGLCNKRSEWLFWRLGKHLMIIRSLEYNFDLPGVTRFHLVPHMPRLATWEQRKTVSNRQTLRKFILCNNCI